MPGNRARRLAKETGGYSLVEMLVASALSVLLLTIIGGFMMTMVRTQGSVTTSTSAIITGQQVSASVDRAVRNSATIVISAVGSDRLLTATTVDSSTTGVWGCSDWYYSATDKTLRFKHSSAAITAPVSTSAQRSWTLVASGVTRIPAAGATVSPEVFAVAGSTTGQTVTFAFRAATGTGSTATFRTVSSTLTLPAGVLTC